MTRSTLSFVLTAALGFVAARAGAQVQFGPWPDNYSADAPVARTDAARVADCAPPENTASPGQIVGVSLNPVGVSEYTILNDVLNYGLAAVVNDSLQYEGRVGLARGGFDTVRLQARYAGQAGDSLVVNEYVFGAGRAGRRDTASVDIAGGERVRIPLPAPDGALFCGSVTDIGDYPAVARRSAVLVDSTLDYRAARAAGTDQLSVLLCNVYGTCDTVLVEVGIVGDTLRLPFFDDFSYPGPRPDARRWLEDDVYVNDGFGLRPPSIGVATFDGLDAGGRPYGDGRGETDVLTSAFVDLSALTSDLGAYLKLYVQRGGRGLVPEERQNDLLIVEARDVEGNWVTLDERAGVSAGNADTTFTFLAYPIDAPRFFHPEFQFRIRTEGNRGGAFDVWNVDYVVLERTNSDAPTFPDIALSEVPRPLTEPYSALPYSQFAGRPELLRDDYTVGIYNHFGVENNVGASRVRVEDAAGEELVGFGLLTGAQFNLPPTQLSEFTNAIPEANLPVLRDAAAGLGASAARTLTLTYVLNLDADQDRSIPGVLRNDTARTATVIDDYYAYDDGTAEIGIGAGQVGNRVLVEYEAFVQDTLRGLRFAFPRLGPVDADRQLINLQVYLGELAEESEPAYELDFVRPFYPADRGDTLQAFTTYRLEGLSGTETPLIVPPGKFYVGWQQATDVQESVPVGFDLGSDRSAQTWLNFGEGWTTLDSVRADFRGAVMVRPVFSAEALGNTSPTADPAAGTHTWRLYPNPSAGEVHLVGLDDALGAGRAARFELIDATGRVVERGALAATLTFRQPPGVYALRLIGADGKGMGQERVVLR